MDGNPRRPRARAPRPPPANQPQLFDDTSQQPPTGYSQYGQQQVPPPQTNMYPNLSGYDQSHYGNQQPAMPSLPGQQFLNDPIVARMGMDYANTFANTGADYVQDKIKQYVPTGKLKYYFAVDTSYVGKKIGLVLFPFAHTDWSIKYNQDEPVAPRYEINAPDLYIPVMAFVTYILLAGAVLGTQNRFTPEQLGTIGGAATVWLIIEILVLLMSMYILQVTTDLSYLDLLAYCGYKYVGMICAIGAGAMFSTSAYYIVLLWCSFALAFFLVRSLKMAVIPHSDADNFSHGQKRRLYMLLVLAFSQPVFMWWLTRYIVFP